MSVASSEFDLIRQYFTDQRVCREDVSLTIGDDAAVLVVPSGCELVVTVDTLVAGVHFPHSTPPQDVAWKAVAVNLSDLAAMGAEPAWATLALTIPEADNAWLEAFSQGLFELLSQYNVQLVGGDTTRGPLSVTMQAYGIIPQGQALRRDQALADDLIFVSGTLGDAGFALHVLQQSLAIAKDLFVPLLARLNRPQPRVDFALNLRGHVHAVIDISDGLLADVGHLCQASGVGARLFLDQLPFSATLQAAVTALYPAEQQRQQLLADLALTAGDDYELCFTAAAAQRAALEKMGAVCVGVMTAEPGVQCVDAAGRSYHPPHSGYDHFARP